MSNGRGCKTSLKAKRGYDGHPQNLYLGKNGIRIPHLIQGRRMMAIASVALAALAQPAPAATEQIRGVEVTCSASASVLCSLFPPT